MAHRYTPSLTVIIGPMFSGKTSELLHLTERHERAGRRRKLIKPKIDDRYVADRVTSHDQRSHPALVTESLLTRLDDVLPEDIVVGIDEGQFFSDLIEAVLLLLERGKIVIVAGLDATANKTKFGAMTDLIVHAENVHKLKAVCKVCGEDASFTLAYEHTEGDVKVGGDEAYYACCRVCRDAAGRPPVTVNETDYPIDVMVESDGRKV